MRFLKYIAIFIALNLICTTTFSYSSIISDEVRFHNSSQKKLFTDLTPLFESKDIDKNREYWNTTHLNDNELRYQVGIWWYVFLYNNNKVQLKFDKPFSWKIETYNKESIGEKYNMFTYNLNNITEYDFNIKINSEKTEHSINIIDTNNNNTK